MITHMAYLKLITDVFLVHLKIKVRQLAKK